MLLPLVHTDTSNPQLTDCGKVVDILVLVSGISPHVQHTRHASNKLSLLSTYIPLVPAKAHITTPLLPTSTTRRTDTRFVH